MPGERTLEYRTGDEMDLYLTSAPEHQSSKSTAHKRRDMRYLTLAAASLCIGLATTVHAGEKMTGDQITALISGNTAYGEHAWKDRHGYAYYREDGTLTGWIHPDGPMTGTWRLKGDVFCEKRTDVYCHEIHDMGDGTYEYYATGTDKHIATWTKIVPGNPENLE
jgi:hypothetical protein